MLVGVAGTVKALDNVNIAATATGYSTFPDGKPGYHQWKKCQEGFSFKIWLAQAGTSPEVNLFIDVSPLTEDIVDNSTDTSKYQAVSLVAATSTEPLTGYVNAVLDDPFCQYRIRVVGTASNHATDTHVTVYVTQFS